MLIIYNKTTGEVVDNSGTSSMWPEGPPDDLAWVNVDAKGLDRSKFEILRLHDTEDAELIAQIRTNLYKINVNSKTVVVQGVRPAPTPIPTPPTVEERLTSLSDLLVAKGTVTREEINTIKEPRIRPARGPS